MMIQMVSRNNGGATRYCCTLYALMAYLVIKTPPVLLLIVVRVRRRTDEADTGFARVRGRPPEARVPRAPAPHATDGSGLLSCMCRP